MRKFIFKSKIIIFDSEAKIKCLWENEYCILRSSGGNYSWLETRIIIAATIFGLEDKLILLRLQWDDEFISKLERFMYIYIK